MKFMMKKLEHKDVFLMSMVKLICQVSRLGSISGDMLTGNFDLKKNPRGHTVQCTQHCRFNNDLVFNFKD